MKSITFLARENTEKQINELINHYESLDNYPNVNITRTDIICYAIYFLWSQVKTVNCSEKISLTNKSETAKIKE